MTAPYDDLIAALRARSDAQDSPWHTPKAVYATKPRAMVDAAADRIEVLYAKLVRVTGERDEAQAALARAVGANKVLNEALALPYAYPDDIERDRLADYIRDQVCCPRVYGCELGGGEDCPAERVRRAIALAALPQGGGEVKDQYSSRDHAPNTSAAMSASPSTGQETEQ